MKVIIAIILFVAVASAFPADKNSPKKPQRPIDSDQIPDKLSDEVPIKRPEQNVNDEIVLNQSNKSPPKKPVRPIENDEIAVKPLSAKKPIQSIENDEPSKPLEVKVPGKKPIHFVENDEPSKPLEVKVPAKKPVRPAMDNEEYVEKPLIVKVPVKKPVQTMVADEMIDKPIAVKNPEQPNKQSDDNDDMKIKDENNCKNKEDADKDARFGLLAALFSTTTMKPAAAGGK